ncbi:hypothetical protein EVAR_28872_1 [Eumeta japonica]|uniref:Uncharacterized protein n=1 Tax=Eumeta variegata TaxID=151549 RepID=A0A4C1X026_EUMVA|nr:hypothetical protein EVAR_28872_1 [Eumeta japonica]
MICIRIGTGYKAWKFILVSSDRMIFSRRAYKTPNNVGARFLGWRSGGAARSSRWPVSHMNGRSVGDCDDVNSRPPP